jgi:hypothetical protein
MGNKNRLDSIIDIKRKMENLFEDMGLEKDVIGDSVVYLNNKKLHYHRIDYIGGSVNALVIESALSYDDAIKNIFEDDDLYPLSLGEENILIKFKKDLKEYYI